MVAGAIVEKGLEDGGLECGEKKKDVLYMPNGLGSRTVNPWGMLQGMTGNYYAHGDKEVFWHIIYPRASMSWFGVEHGYEVLSPESQAVLTIAETADGAPYILYNTTYARIYGVAPPKGYHPLVTIKSYGLKVCTIYEKDS